MWVCVCAFNCVCVCVCVHVHASVCVCVYMPPTLTSPGSTWACLGMVWYPANPPQHCSLSTSSDTLQTHHNTWQHCSLSLKTSISPPPPLYFCITSVWVWRLTHLKDNTNAANAAWRSLHHKEQRQAALIAAPPPMNHSSPAALTVYFHVHCCYRLSSKGTLAQVTHSPLQSIPVWTAKCSVITMRLVDVQ